MRIDNTHDLTIGKIYWTYAFISSEGAGNACDQFVYRLAEDIHYHRGPRQLYQSRRVARPDVEPEGAFFAFGFEFGHELGAAVDLDGFDLEVHLGLQLVEEQRSCGSGGAAIGFGDGPFGDRAIGGELPDRTAWA